MENKAFTLIELLVTVAIIGILSLIVLFSTRQYINSSKDVSVRGNLSILPASGEVYYNTNLDSYKGIIPGKDFCTSSVVVNVLNQIPKPPSNRDCSTGLCCFVNSLGNAWAACAQLFTYSAKAFCVDSRGIQREINNSSCTSAIAVCP